MVRDAPVVVFVVVADEFGPTIDVGRVDGLTGSRLGEPLRVGSVLLGLIVFSDGCDSVGLRNERVRWREDITAR